MTILYDEQIVAAVYALKNWKSFVESFIASLYCSNFPRMLLTTNIFWKRFSEKDTLKSLAPVSLLPVIAGYIFEGKEMNIDWNSYTIVLIGGLLVYLYSLWKCNRDMEEWKRRGLDIREDLMKVEYNKDKPQREVEELKKIEKSM